MSSVFFQKFSFGNIILSNPQLAPIVDCVPASNLGKNSGMLCIRLGNLQFTNFPKTCKNPNIFFAFFPCSATISVRGGAWTSALSENINLESHRKYFAK